MTSTAIHSAVVLGGDPAGLTAALLLTNHGYHVTVIDRRLPIGGAATRADASDSLEPFTILGCHRSTRSLLDSLYPSTHQPLETEIPLEFHLLDNSLVHYPSTSFPAPLHTWVSLLKFSGMPWKERWRLASWVEQLWEGDEELPGDLEQRTADEWFASIEQNAETRRVVWNPIARWLTGNDLSTISADAFITSLRPFFLRTRSDSRISVVQNSLQTCLMQPMIERLTQLGATILRNPEAIQLRYQQDRISGVLLQDGSKVHADWYVAALPPHELTPLLPERWLTRYAYFQQLTELRSVDSTTFYIYAEQPCATSRLILLNGPSFHSILAAPTVDGRTVFSLVTTNDRLSQHHPDPNFDVTHLDLLRSLGLLKPDSRVSSIRRRIIPSGILLLKPGAKSHRPIPRSPIANLLVAGAWTDTGWPPNLESAIVSGNRCAEAITSDRPI